MAELDRIARAEKLFAGIQHPYDSGWSWYDKYGDLMYNDPSGKPRDHSCWHDEDLLAFAKRLDGKHRNVVTFIRDLDPLHKSGLVADVAIGLARHFDLDWLRTLPADPQGFLDGWYLRHTYDGTKSIGDEGLGITEADLLKIEAFNDRCEKLAQGWLVELQKEFDKIDERIEVDRTLVGYPPRVPTSLKLWPKNYDAYRIRENALTFDVVMSSSDWRRVDPEDLRVDHAEMTCYDWLSESVQNVPRKWYRTQERFAGACRRVLKQATWL